MGTIVIDNSMGSGVSLDNLAGEQLEAHPYVDATAGLKFTNYYNFDHRYLGRDLYSVQYSNFLAGADVTARSRISESTATTLTAGPSVSWHRGMYWNAHTDKLNQLFFSVDGRAYGGAVLGTGGQALYGVGASVGVGSGRGMADWKAQLKVGYENYLKDDLHPQGSNALLVGVAVGAGLYHDVSHPD